MKIYLIVYKYCKDKEECLKEIEIVRGDKIIMKVKEMIKDERIDKDVCKEYGYDIFEDINERICLEILDINGYEVKEYEI